MNRSLLVAWLLSCVFVAEVSAQRVEPGLYAGLSGYQGELSPLADGFHQGKLNPSAGVFLRYNILPRWSVRTALTWARIEAADAEAFSPVQRQRNLSFRSDIGELAGIVEWHLVPFLPQGNKVNPVAPYLFAGLAVFHHNPKALYQGNWIALQPLGTEGQGMPGRPKPYALWQVAVPMGGGVKIHLGYGWTLGLELGLRKTFTDYLDDVSTTYVNYRELAAAHGELAALLANRTGEYLGTEPVDLPTGTARGNPATDDWYFSGGITLSKVLFGGHMPWRPDQDFGCPRF